MTETAAAYDPAKIRAVDPWYWAYFNQIRLQSAVFALEGHEYLAEPLRCNHPDQVAIKGAQMGFTELTVIKTLHGMIYKRLPQGALHLFPTSDDIADFSRARFNPLIDNNPIIAAHVKSTDATEIKRIGDAMLYLRGARETKKIQGLVATSSKLKSIPVDRIVFDERDEMADDMVTLALDRFAHSEIQEQFELSTPTVPDYGVDKSFRKSNQQYWEITCQACGKGTVLELEFPDVLERREGKVVRVCRHCRREIHPRDGRWVALYPSVTEKVGWRISQLNSVYTNLRKILEDFEHIKELAPGERQVLYNSKLAQAYVDSTNKLSPQDLYRIQSQDMMDAGHYGPCAMGVDVGTWLNVVIGYRDTHNSKKLCYVGRHKEWSDVHDLAQRFNVRSAVIDLEPEQHKAREFQKAEPYEIFLCDYLDKQHGDAAWNLETGIVKINRTEIMDLVQSAVLVPGRLTIPRLNQEIQEHFVPQMCNVVKVLMLGANKIWTYRYKDVGPDHYRHATGYFLLASDRVAVVEPRLTPYERRGQVKDAYIEDPLGRREGPPRLESGGYDRAVTQDSPFS